MTAKPRLVDHRRSAYTRERIATFPPCELHHISRTVEGATQMVLVNAAPPSKALNLKHATLQVNVDFDFESSTSASFERCLVLEFTNAIDAHAIAKVAEHLTRDETTSKSGDDLHHSLNVFRDLVKAKLWLGLSAHCVPMGRVRNPRAVAAYADTPQTTPLYSGLAGVQHSLFGLQPPRTTHFV